MENKFKRILTLVMVMVFLSGFCFQASAYAATSNKKNNSILNTNKVGTNGSEIDNELDSTHGDVDNSKTSVNNDGTSSNTLDSSASSKEKTSINNSEDKTDETTKKVSDDNSQVNENKTGWGVINGKRFYFNKEGMLKKTGWFEIDEYIYKGTEKDPKIAQAVLIENNKIQDKENGTSLENHSKVEFDPSKDSNYELHRNIYYLDSDYSAMTGWQEIAGKWYNFNDFGIMKTDWIGIDDRWYYLNNDGTMQTGWMKLGADKYYLTESGSMVRGKVNIDDKWYYFNGSGLLQTGVYLKNGVQSYSTKDGEMVSNKWISINNNRYYVKANSELAIGDVIIDGNMESFDENGLYIGRGIMKEHLYVKYLDVGDADCIYTKLPSGETALIDTGYNTKDSETKLINFLSGQNLKEDEDGNKIIDYVIITHPHSDHIGGLLKVLKKFTVKKVYMPKYSHIEDCSETKLDGLDDDSIKIMNNDYKVYKKTMEFMKENNIELLDATQGTKIDEEGILKFIQIDKDYFDSRDKRASAKYWSINNQSAVVYLKYGDLDALFTGDIQWAAERDISKYDLLKGAKIDVLKVSHHGLDTSSTWDFICYIGADIGVMTRATNSIAKDIAYNNLIAGGVSILEASEKDGVSLYATKQNWNIQH
ncbi:MBL fold metallo-hydrolase [Clostridium uliginosum]|uniref:Metal-dependent hydrolase, beta-lactamase superfamily II n=1 Tax=Clostridium uliginosum TaxID=119641 RepID=A0A1I1PQ73_9CLOT|nr:MBL fold metallo-hydrolase [Clostridium uliginosum]SFD08150.1 Metal-dependent hydrolase, beta-lactamase superfamily II [Clostridium uliginosum]